MAKAMARRTYFSPRRPAGPPHSVAPTLNNNHEGVGRASAMGIVELISRKAASASSTPDAGATADLYGGCPAVRRTLYIARRNNEEAAPSG